LFGYEKGAFTGALRSKQGLLQSADTGTIFFDEVGELPLEMQAKLLRFLQEKEVRPVGSNQKVKVDVRIMAATNRDLDAEYKKGTFRKDLYFRLNVVTISLPPAARAPFRHSDPGGMVPRTPRSRTRRPVSGNAMKALLAYDWPGQCPRTGKLPGARRRPRRSEHHRSQRPAAIHRARGSPGGTARFAENSPAPTSAPPIWKTSNAPRSNASFLQVKGDKALAGKMLGISRATLYRKLKRYNIGVREDPPQSTTLQ
jgi:transcriptional regulator with PAS, ATPase and Fis domain